MHQFLEAASIALSAIWSNKLRSFLTVLGNIVAVTSIIAVVSLVQGLNASVKDAIQSGIGVDTFSVQQFGISMSEEDFQKQASNPRITLDDAAAIRSLSPSVRLVMAQSGTSAQVKYREESLDSRRDSGRHEGIHQPADDQRRDGARDHAVGIRQRAGIVTILGFDTADKLFGALDPIDKIVSIDGSRFQVVGVAAKKGSVFGQSQDEFAVIPLAAFRHVFGTRGGLSLSVQPRDISLVKTAMDETTLAMRIQRRLRPKQPDNFGVLSSDTIPGPLQPGDGRHLRDSHRRRQPLARGRRHRHHEHHVDGRHRADARRSGCASPSARAGGT